MEPSPGGGVEARTRGTRPAQSGPQEASTLWLSVVDGRWSLVEQGDHGDSRCFLLRRNDRESLARRALTERERQIVAHASMGHSNKLIAYELGLSSSTVAAQLTSARTKLGVSRETLLHAFAVLGNGTAEAMPPSDASLPAAPPRDDARVVHVARFTHDGQDYAVIRIVMEQTLPKDLTVAEAEVATLAIAGLSNAEIALRRKTSVRTVANQLRSIYSKLRVGSRRQLSLWFSSHRSPEDAKALDAHPGRRIEGFSADRDARLAE